MARPFWLTGITLRRPCVSDSRSGGESLGGSDAVICSQRSASGAETFRDCYSGINVTVHDVVNEQ